jgi:hypothetical protein
VVCGKSTSRHRKAVSRRRRGSGRCAGRHAHRRRAHINNSRLAGLRTWPVKGFDEFRVYYLTQPDLVAIIRILHDKRDIGSILERQTVEDPSQH